MSKETSVITISVDDRASRDRQLEQAISLLREEAIGCGILVTRVKFTTFTVAISPGVAFGLTQEGRLDVRNSRVFSQDRTKTVRTGCRASSKSHAVSKRAPCPIKEQHRGGRREAPPADLDRFQPWRTSPRPVLIETCMTLCSIPKKVFAALEMLAHELVRPGRQLNRRASFMATRLLT